jgi:feruloyl esterase
MNKNRRAIFAVPFFSLAIACTLSAADSCAALKSLHLPDTRITSVASIAPAPVWTLPAAAPGAARPINVSKPFCRVEGVIEKEIGFEVWLPPASNWNGKYLGTGQGGMAGIENYRDMARGVDRGYASASTDTGHKISDPNWMLGDPQRLANLGYRSNHLLQDQAKKIVAAYYGKPPQYSYFIGCSQGGRLGMKEAQQFPDDYDGIITGTPAPLPTVMNVRFVWELALLMKDPSVTMSDADWQLVADAGVKACEARAGLVDGIAEDPRRCHIDWPSVQCKGDKRNGCLSAAQVKLAQAIYAPFRDESGKQLDYGFTSGSKASIPAASSGGIIGQIVYHDANWGPSKLRITEAIAGMHKNFPDWDIDRSDLRPFKNHRGKLIGYQGWIDPTVLALNTVAGYEAVQHAMGGESQTSDFYRLFMVPGMAHCGGGPGANEFGGSGADAPIVDASHDVLSALENWVEKGHAPDRIIASKLDSGKVVRTHPLCAYPEEARYKGAGNPADAASFTRARLSN